MHVEIYKFDKTFFVLLSAISSIYLVTFTFWKGFLVEQGQLVRELRDHVVDLKLKDYYIICG